MSDARQDLQDELDALLKEGELLLLDEVVQKTGGDLLDQLGNAAQKADAQAKSERGKGNADAARDVQREHKKRTKETFGRRYQRWYSRSLAAIEQLMPDRYDEFRELYRLDKRAGELDITTYTINDYIHGLIVTRGPGSTPAFDTFKVAIGRLNGQLDLLGAARSRLDSRLADITGVLEAGIFDDELTAARGLVKTQYLRSAGVIAGVVLERHLKRLVKNHEITFRKKAQLGNLNDALKAGGVYGVAQWRKIQRLADIRNQCGHAGDEPSKTDVEELIDGVEKTVETVF